MIHFALASYRVLLFRTGANAPLSLALLHRKGLPTQIENNINQFDAANVIAGFSIKAILTNYPQNTLF